MFHECFVGFKDDFVFEITWFFLTDDRVDENAVYEGKRCFLYVFMANMWWISGLKCDDFLPSFFFEKNPGFSWCEIIVMELSWSVFEKGDFSTDKMWFHLVDICNTGVIGIDGSVDVLCECFFFVGVDVFDGELCEEAGFLVCKKYGVSFFGVVKIFFGEVKEDGYCPWGVICESFFMDDVF